MKNLIDKNFFITGGSGFIGSNFILKLFKKNINAKVLNFDKLSDQSDHEFIIESENYKFFKGDLCNEEEIHNALIDFQPDYIIHFAAESHVDRSITNPHAFIFSNTLGSFNLFNAVKNLQDINTLKNIRIINISTDEVYGSLGDDDIPFSTDTQFNPSSAYSASKSSADSFANAFIKTYGQRIQTTHCTNNYGPRQFPEKLIPLTIYNFLNDLPVKIYGDGKNIRDWIHVDDHNEAILAILNSDYKSKRYNIGSSNENRNIEIIDKIQSIMFNDFSIKKKYKREFVDDRKGHDYRYAINSHLTSEEIGWSPIVSFDDGIKHTIEWYLENTKWFDRIKK